MAGVLVQTSSSRDPLENSSWCCLKVSQLCQWPVLKLAVIELINNGKNLPEIQQLRRKVADEE